MEQFDLFAGGGQQPSPSAASPRVAPPAQASPPGALSDAALIEAIPEAGRSTCDGLAGEASRRRLRAAVPALEALCRRFRGFGQARAVPEQMAALRALAELGGPEAAAAVRRILAGDVVAAPGLPDVVRAAAALRCILPEQTAAMLLRHPEPGVRADACRCVPRTQSITALLVSLLEDLHPDVARAAAIALARRGAPEGRPLLLRLLRQAPAPELLDAVAGVADDEATVLIGRIARQDPGLRDAAVAALESIETPRAAALRTALQKQDESRAAC